MIAQPLKKLFCEISFTDEIDWLTIKTAENPRLRFHRRYNVSEGRFLGVIRAGLVFSIFRSRLLVTWTSPYLADRYSCLTHACNFLAPQLGFGLNASLDRFFQGLRQLAIGQGLAEMAMDHLRIERLGHECRLLG